MKRSLSKAHSPFNPNTSLQIKVRKDGITFGRWVNIRNEDNINNILQENFHEQLHEDFHGSLEESLYSSILLRDLITFNIISPMRKLTSEESDVYYKFLSYLLGTRFILPDQIALNKNNYRTLQLDEDIYMVKFVTDEFVHELIVENSNNRLRFTSATININNAYVKHPSFIMLYTISSILKELYKIDKRFIPGLSMVATTNPELIGAGVWPYKGGIIEKESFSELSYLKSMLQYMFLDDEVSKFSELIDTITTFDVSKYYSVPPEYIEVLNMKFTWRNNNVKQRELKSFKDTIEHTSNSKSSLVRSKILDKLKNDSTISLRDLLKFQDMMLEVIVSDPNKVYRLFHIFNFSK